MSDMFTRGIAHVENEFLRCKVGPVHKRLIGTWKSDKRKTLRTYRAYAGFSRSKKQRVSAVFGRQEVRYTPKFYYVTLNGETTKNRYDVVAEDADSIVLRIYSDGFRKRIDPIILDGLEELLAPRLEHLHFEVEGGQEYYWVGIRVLVEWFKKM